jgi:hypothetical protein
MPAACDTIVTKNRPLHYPLSTYLSTFAFRNPYRGGCTDGILEWDNSRGSAYSHTRM